MHRWKRQVGLWLARNRRSRLGRAIGTASTALAGAYENDSADLETNGESRVLDCLAPCSIATVFDVGAHEGEWTRRAIRSFPAATIYAFEIEPEHRERLRRALESPRVVVAPHGLAEAAGEVDLFVDTRFPQTTSLISWDEDDRNIVQCRVEAGDRYLEEHDLSYIDLLKVDTEGADFDVLRGFGDALAWERIGMIQFEFTLWAAIARTWLRDFYEYLQPYGFSIGKVYPTYVDWREYSPHHEIFVKANYVAVHQSRPDLRSAI